MLMSHTRYINCKCDVFHVSDHNSLDDFLCTYQFNVHLYLCVFVTTASLCAFLMLILSCVIFDKSVLFCFLNEAL